MMQRPPRPTRTGTLVPYTTVFRSGLGRDVQRDLGGGQDVDHRLGRHAVGEDGVDLVHMGEAHYGVAAELGMIGGEEHPARVLDDRLGGAHLAVVEVEQRAVVVDARDADDAEVALEPLVGVNAGLAADTWVAAAPTAAGD